mgnify:CR=1 FL=1
MSSDSKFASRFFQKSFCKSSSRKLVRMAMTVIVIGVLGGCSGSAKEDELNRFYAGVQEQKKGRIKPLPPFETVAPFAYQASNLRSPFEPPIAVSAARKPRTGRAVKPDPTRVKQFLEQFNVGQLAMVGTLAQGGQLYGLVRDYESGVHRVRAGDYMGSDHGRILKIDDASIELLEIVADGAGGWVERQRLVTMGAGG